MQRAAGGSPAARFDYWARQELCTDGEEMIGKYARQLFVSLFSLPLNPLCVL
jgi:hypothetical protein